MTPTSSPCTATPAPGLVDHADLLDAMETQRFGVLLQPQYRLPALDLCGFEALARLHVSHEHWLTPEHFLPLAQTTGLINKLTLHVIESACRTLQLWRGTHRHGMFIAVNIDSTDLTDVLFAPRVCRLLALYRLLPGELELELTEGRMHHSSAVVETNIRLLRQAGVRMAMDDFGSGHSTLARLADLPFDIVKIDKAFLAQVPDQARACTLLSSVINLCLALRKEVVVEGVETDAQLRWLARLRWHRVRLQGNGLSLPLTEPLAGHHVPLASRLSHPQH